jgi:hypothetical protein
VYTTSPTFAFNVRLVNKWAGSWIISLAAGFKTVQTSPYPPYESPSSLPAPSFQPVKVEAGNKNRTFCIHRTAKGQELGLGCTVC